MLKCLLLIKQTSAPAACGLLVCAAPLQLSTMFRWHHALRCDHHVWSYITAFHMHGSLSTHGHFLYFSGVFVPFLVRVTGFPAIFDALEILFSPSLLSSFGL